MSFKPALLLIITSYAHLLFAEDCASGYCVDPTTDITCGQTRDCTILCDHMGSCTRRVFTFLNDWGQTKDKYKATLICKDYGACDNIVIIANTSQLYLDFEGNDQSSMEAYITFGSYSNTQHVHINCNGSYSCNSGSFVFNSMIDTNTVQSNGIINIGCNTDGSCKQMVITAFQAYNVNINCFGYESCHELTIYSPIKPAKNTYVNCDSMPNIVNSSYDETGAACKNMRIYNYGGKHLTNVDCNDYKCDIELFCGFMYEYNCDYFNCTDKYCNASMNEYIITPNNNQLIVSPNKLIMDYTLDIFKGKEIYIYISTLYEKFIYFYNKKESDLYNASYPRIHCPVNGICNIICVDVGYGAAFDHCAYGIFYGNLSLEMNVRGYEADNSKWYGPINSFYWNGRQGNKNINFFLQSTQRQVIFDCNGTSDLYSYSNIEQWGCDTFNIRLSTLDLFEMNCWKTSSCPSTQIYSDMGQYHEFPTQFELHCNASEHTSCREMDLHFGDGSGCEFAITSTNLTYFYWDCINWYTAIPTMAPTITPTVHVNLHKSNTHGYIIPLIVVIAILLLAIIVFIILKKYGKPQLTSFMNNRRKRNHDKSQSFVGLKDISSSTSH